MGKKSKARIGVILGPTASGKTALSIALAKACNAQIVSADSVQVYKGMDIGSAKPDREERQGVRHHMLDVWEPDAPGCSAALYQRMAFACIEEIRREGCFPLVVGGTGLYINALTYPLRFAAVPADAALRAELEAEEKRCPGVLLERLKSADPESARRLHPHDIKRIERALEVYLLTGKPIGAFGPGFDSLDEEALPYAPRIVGLHMPREQLYARIGARVDAMMQAGLLEETKALLARGCNASMPSMQALGYRQLCAHLRGECTLAEAVETIKRDTRRFAKRQLTWFRRDARIHWLDVSAMPFASLLAEARAHMEGKGE